MKFGLNFSLLGAACSLLASTFAPHASAEWKSLPNLANNAQQAVGLFGTIYATRGARVNGGYQVQTPFWQNENVITWQNVGTAIASSITVGNGKLWLVDPNSDVWVKGTAGWGVYPSTICEGSSHLLIAQAPPNLPHNTIAAGYAADSTDHVYVVSDGTTRWWSGTCWQRMPNLPSGAVLDVAIDSKHLVAGSPQLPWVASTTGAVYFWNGGSWISSDGALAKGVSNGADVIGSDGASFWHYNGTTWGQEDWTGGALRSIGSTQPFRSSQPEDIVVSTSGTIWYRNL